MSDTKINECHKQCDIKLLVTIVDRGRSERLIDILREEQVLFHFICLAEGTAGSDIMDLLGLGSSEKAFFVCLKPRVQMQGLIAKVCERMQLSKPGRGIAFTLSPSGLNNSLLKLLTSGVQMSEIGDDETVDCAKHKNSGYDLIIAVINQGHIEDVMDAAKSVGARGGTVLHGRRVGVEEEAKFFGISVQHEKEIVTILVPHDIKGEIMAAVTERCGMSKSAQGMIMSLPVDEIYGLTPIDKS